jgi:hypothetical protein
MAKITSAPSPKAFVETWSTDFKAAVEKAAGKDGRLSLAEAKKIAKSVTGDAMFGAGSTLSLKADASSPSSAMLAIDGAAALAGTVVVDFGDATPAVGSVYTLLTAGSITGSFAVSLPNGVFGQLDYAAGSVTLEITDSAPDGIFTDGFDGGARIVRDGGIRR